MKMMGRIAVFFGIHESSFATYKPSSTFPVFRFAISPWVNLAETGKFLPVSAINFPLLTACLNSNYVLLCCRCLSRTLTTYDPVCAIPPPSPSLGTFKYSIFEFEYFFETNTNISFLSRAWGAFFPPPARGTRVCCARRWPKAGGGTSVCAFSWMYDQ